jgi:CheY-like chemotaxis protein
MTNKILIVEDNEQYRQGVREFFERMLPVETTFAGDYVEAIHVLYSRPSGAIIDCFFPGDSESESIGAGFDAVEMMRRASRRDTPIEKAIDKVRDVCGAEAAALFARNAKVKDGFLDLEVAMRRDYTQQPLGVLVADEAERLGIPFVLATSTYHHDSLTQPIQDYCNHRGWQLIDCLTGHEDHKASPDFWESAYSSLARRMGGQDE